jgi:hypothetical protein
MKVQNPFEEEVSPSRRLHSEAPPSPHRAGRQPKMKSQVRRLRRNRIRARIQEALDDKAVKATDAAEEFK